MKFCIISPTAGLEKFSTLSTTHLVLAHVEDTSYQDFYLKRREAGDFLILDNGAHEKGKSIDMDWLRAMIDFYKPQVAVLPDVLDNPYQTLKQSLAFLEKYTFPSDLKWMFVVQAQKSRHTPTISWFDDKFLLELIHEHPSIEWLGISRYLSLNHGFSRAYIKEKLSRILPTMHFHALGMVEGSIEELMRLADSGFASVDSSVPVWRGWLGYDLIEPATPWWEASVEFSAGAPGRTHTGIIHRNLKVCLEAANADTTELL